MILLKDFYLDKHYRKKWPQVCKAFMKVLKMCICWLCAIFDQLYAYYYLREEYMEEKKANEEAIFISYTLNKG